MVSIFILIVILFVLRYTLCRPKAVNPQRTANPDTNNTNNLTSVYQRPVSQPPLYSETISAVPAWVVDVGPAAQSIAPEDLPPSYEEAISDVKIAGSNC